MAALEVLPRDHRLKSPRTKSLGNSTAIPEMVSNSSGRNVAIRQGSGYKSSNLNCSHEPNLRSWVSQLVTCGATSLRAEIPR